MNTETNSNANTVVDQLLVRCLSDLIKEAESVFKYLDKIEPYEEHEMSPDTPNPDGYWIALENAKSALSANLVLRP